METAIVYRGCIRDRGNSFNVLWFLSRDHAKTIGNYYNIKGVSYLGIMENKMETIVV